MIALLAASWLSLAYLFISLYLHKQELKKANKAIESLVKECNKLHRERKQKTIQIKRLCQPTIWN